MKQKFYEYEERTQNHPFTPSELNVMGFLSWSLVTIIRYKSWTGLTQYKAYFKRQVSDRIANKMVDEKDKIRTSWDY